MSQLPGLLMMLSRPVEYEGLPWAACIQSEAVPSIFDTLTEVHSTAEERQPIDERRVSILVENEQPWSCSTYTQDELRQLERSARAIVNGRPMSVEDVYAMRAVQEERDTQTVASLRRQLATADDRLHESQMSLRECITVVPTEHHIRYNIPFDLAL